MDELKGWIALYRAIIDNEFLWSDTPFARGQSWIDLLLLANHKTKRIFFDGKLVEVERGSMITSMTKLAERWGWSRTKVTSFLKTLVDEKMLEYKVVDRKYTLIRIVNYNKIQGDNVVDKKKNNVIHTENTDEQRLSEVINNEEKPLKNHRKATEKPLKNHRKATEKPLKNINNNVNNINNDNNTRSGVRALGEHQHVMLRDFEMKSLLNELGEDKFLRVVRKLDDYIERTGKQYNKQHFLVIKDWVIQAVEDDEKREQTKPKKVNKFNDFPQRKYSQDELEDIELRKLGIKK